MAYYDTTWYCNAGNQSTTGYYAVPLRPQNTAVAAGQLCRQFTAPAVGSERVFACIIAGTTANVTDATWVLTRGARTTDGTATWQECTGASAVNGDLTNTPTWAAAKAINSAVTLGAIIQRNNGASYWICSTAGSTGASEPAWANNTAGTTQTDSTVTWTCLGVVGNFTGGQAPHARLPNAATINWFAPGNTIYVGDNHAESQATAITINPAAGTITSIGRILCHNHSGNYPPAAADLTTGATITTTAAVSITFNPTGYAYVYGIAFKAGVGVSTSCFLNIATGVSSWVYLDNCSFWLASTSISCTISVVATSGINAVVWNNCTVKFASVQQYIGPQNAGFIWQNTGPILASGSSVPTTLIAMQSNSLYTTITMEALDLSQITGNIFGVNQVLEGGNRIIKDCKLNASASIMSGNVVTAPSLVIQNVRCDSGATGYKSARYKYEGTETTETSITRVGGASDPTGQAQSRKIVTTANSQWLMPFKAAPYAQWNPTTGANVTVTVYGTINAGALPNNDDIWLEVEYLGSSSSPLGTIVTTTKSNVLAANAAVASDGSAWNLTGTLWNSIDLLTMTLSNGGLTATSTATLSGVRANYGLSSGKYYWECTVSTWVGNTTGIGIGLATAGLNANIGGVGSAGVGRLSALSINNVTQATNLGNRTSGDIIGVAVDLTAGLIWFRVAPAGNWNGSGAANPATGAGGFSLAPIAGTLFPMFAASISGDVGTANFGTSSFSGAVPSGFTSGWPNVWTPFKLTTTLSAPQPGQAGYLEARVRVAKPGATYYLDPKIVLS